MTSPTSSREPELRLEHVGGVGNRMGWKSALMAVGAFVVAIAGVAVMGRGPGSPAAIGQPSGRMGAGGVIAPTDVPASSAHDPSPPPDGPPTPWPTRKPVGEPPPEAGISAVRFGADAYALITQIDGRAYRQVLHEYRTGRLRGSFRIPFPSNPDDDYTFEFAQLWTRQRNAQSLVVVDSWTVSLAPLQPNTTNSASLISAMAHARPRQRAAPRAVRRGYSISVGAESRYNFGVISVDVTFGSGADRQASLVYRDWPLRQLKDDYAVLYRRGIDLQR